MQSQLKHTHTHTHTPGKAKIYEISFNSFCVLLENKADRAAVLLKAIENHL